MKFQDLLSSLGIPFKEHGSHHHTSLGRIQFDCPWCSPNSNRFRMGYHLSWGTASCWSCGPCKLLPTVAELARVSQGQARTLLKDVDRPRPLPLTDRPKGVLQLPKGLGGLDKAHITYLTGRGFDCDMIERLWGIKGLGLHKRLAWRVFIPITYRNQTVSWTTRSISDDVAKRYISASPEEETYPHKDLLYGMDYAHSSIIICEGPLDVWKIGPGAVATFGTTYSKAQISKMLMFNFRGVCFDNEPDAQKRAKELCDSLDVFNGKTYNIVLDSKDPGSASKKEINKVRRAFLD